ncbi:kinesin-like protein KIF20B [Electrophorus electricus]|uniref:kinesin-like protein KIF20B n=1 Tax=Electrophorus electricus TaxID=8005 RepID=UPI0015D088D8|nr:kinesin-like protein KIF20B [Electrophorus electricus]
MESCLNYKPERVGAVIVEDLRKDLFAEFSKVPTYQESVLLEKEHLQVYLRIRPFTSTESGFGESQGCISIDPPETVVLKAPRSSLAARQSERLGPQVAQRFQFSKVYGPDATQREVFDGTTKALVKDVLKGENSLIFTYGVTNAGKTFTFLGPETDGGILPRSLHVIFNSIEGRLYTQNNIKPHRCIDFTRLTKDQQDEEATNKKNLLRRLKESGLQKSTCNVSNSTCSSLLEGYSYGELDGESLCLEEDSNIKFSIWVSFSEIYNENIHDLLDFVSSGSQRRSTLRLCQDVKGNTFVKDQTWIQVNSADEAYRILKIGRKNQSFSSTKINSVSSRSHSIFSIRVLRLEDVGVPRVQTISELSLCDLAGSERCTKTQNRGVRLKESGNINTSLLTLGKCINALRLNQTYSKFQQHIPFRDSKLTHYLQGFFCGRGKACMIVNINQCASVYDETLNVLKFSALAQKVVVLNPKPVSSAVPKKSARDVSMILNNVEKKEWMRRRTLIAWETSLEDVREGEDDEEMEEEEECDEESMVENTVQEAEDQELHELHQKIKELREKLSNEESEKLAMESRIRQEVSTEFMELFSDMEKDYNERLQREKDIAEERTERRLEILKNLTNETFSGLADTGPVDNTTKEARMEFLDGMMEVMQGDLAKIKQDAEATQKCLENAARSPGVVARLRAQLDKVAEELLESQRLLGVKTKEMDTVLAQRQKSSDQLLEANKNYENRVVRCQELMAICQEKDEMISKLQTALDRSVEAANEERAFIDTVKEEILHYRNNCKCLVNDGKEEMKDQEIQRLVLTLKERDELVDKLKHEQDSLQEKVKELTDELKKQAQAYGSTVSMLEAEKAATAKLAGENRALSSKLSELQQTTSDMSVKLKALKTDLGTQISAAIKLSEELETAKALLREGEEERSKQSSTIGSLKLEVENLRQKLHAHAQELFQGRESDCAFRKTIESLRKECEAMMSASQEKSRRIEALEPELSRAREELCQLENTHEQFRRERDAQREEACHALDHYEAERQAAERQAAEQATAHSSELRVELDGARQRLAALEEQARASSHSSERARELELELAERHAQCASLQETLQQCQSELAQAREALRKQRGTAEEVEKRSVEAWNTSQEAERRRREMEQELACKDAELKTKAQESLKLETQVAEELGKIQSLRADLQQKEKRILDLQAKVSQGSTDAERLRTEVTALTEEIRALRQKLNDAEEERDRAMSTLPSKAQTVAQPNTEQSSSQEALQECKRFNTSFPHRSSTGSKTLMRNQLLPDKDRLMEEMQLTLTDSERTRVERALAARLKVIESLSEELMKLKKWQREHATASGPDHAGQGQDTTGHWTRARKLVVQSGGKLLSPDEPRRAKQRDQMTGQPQQKTDGRVPADVDCSALSTEDEKDNHFPKLDVEISFTPLKPNPVNLRRPGGDASVTVKTGSKARKRRSAAVENLVQSENRKKLRLQGSSRAEVLPVQSPMAVGKKSSPFKRKDPASLRSRKDGALQKIGDFIQSSPTLLGSKGKKIMAMVKSPESQPDTAANSKPKRSKRKLFKGQISSPYDSPSHPMLEMDPDDKESDHFIIKRKLRTRTAKRQPQLYISK